MLGRLGEEGEESGKEPAMGGEEDAAEVEKKNRVESEAGEQKEDLGVDTPRRSCGGVAPGVEDDVPWAEPVWPPMASN